MYLHVCSIISGTGVKSPLTVMEMCCVIILLVKLFFFMTLLSTESSEHPSECYFSDKCRTSSR